MLTSMTMLSKDDPNSGTERCMRCAKYESYRNVSTFANELRLYLCPTCQKDLTSVVRSWLGPAAAVLGFGPPQPRKLEYRHKPQLVEAEQFFPDRLPWPAHVQDHGADDAGFHVYSVRSLSGRVPVVAGDWIVIDSSGAPYPCKPVVFWSSYEPVPIEDPCL